MLLSDSRKPQPLSVRGQYREPTVATWQRKVSKAEWRVVFTAAGRLPRDYYSELFDPLVVPGEQPPVIGSLSDDIADIYSDVMDGLRLYQAGNRAAAVWKWRFGVQHHWGAHATGAIRALHSWLATNAPERLGSDA